VHDFGTLDRSLLLPLEKPVFCSKVRLMVFATIQAFLEQ